MEYVGPTYVHVHNVFYLMSISMHDDKNKHAHGHCIGTYRLHAVNNGSKAR